MSEPVEKKEKKNKKASIWQIVGIVAFMAVGAIGGFLAGAYFMSEPSTPDGTGSKSFLDVVIILVCFYVIMYLEIIIHEAGHLVMGLLTGYKFVSFRVGSFLLQKKKGKFELKKFTLPGTGGQCLLSPPDVSYEKLPFKLYFLGGVLFNLLTCLVAGGFYFVVPKGTGSMICVITILLGFFFALTNGLPINAGTIMNDGYNVIDLSKNAASRMGLWLQLKTNACQTDGARIKDLPDEWFVVPEGADTKNVNFTSGLVFFESRYMDQHDFSAAKDMIEKLLSEEYKIAGIYQGLLKLDRFYIDVYEGNEEADLSIFDDNMVKTIVKQMKDTPMTCRSLYAKAVLENDLEAQAMALVHLEKIVRIYPAEGEILAEKDLIQLLQNK